MWIFCIALFTFLFLLSLSPPASVCFAVCLLSLAWALVLYARACSLIRPGHLQMTPAAILCRLLWRVGIFYHLSILSVFDMSSVCFGFVCDSSIFSVRRSVCWDPDLLFSCSSHGSSNNGSWELLVSPNAKNSSHSSYWIWYTVHFLIRTWVVFQPNTFNYCWVSLGEDTLSWSISITSMVCQCPISSEIVSLCEC